jgi:hypothetical protein
MKPILDLKGATLSHQLQYVHYSAEDHPAPKAQP